MSNIVRKSLSMARDWVLSKPHPERKLAAMTGVDARTFRYAAKPSWDPRASTLAAILDAMSESGEALSAENKRGQVSAQAADCANATQETGKPQLRGEAA